MSIKLSWFITSNCCWIEGRIFRNSSSHLNIDSIINAFDGNKTLKGSVHPNDKYTAHSLFPLVGKFRNWIKKLNKALFPLEVCVIYSILRYCVWSQSDHFIFSSAAQPRDYFFGKTFLYFSREHRKIKFTSTVLVKRQISEMYLKLNYVHGEITTGGSGGPFKIQIFKTEITEHQRIISVSSTDLRVFTLQQSLFHVRKVLTYFMRFFSVNLQKQDLRFCLNHFVFSWFIIPLHSVHFPSTSQHSKSNLCCTEATDENNLIKKGTGVSLVTLVNKWLFLWIHWIMWGYN